MKAYINYADKVVSILILALSINAMTVPEARSDLINAIGLSTPESFVGSVDDTVLTPAVRDLSTAHWFVVASQLDLDVGGVANDIVVDARHRVGVPGHPGEGGNPNFLARTLFNVVPGGPVIFGGASANHLPLAHADLLGLRYGPRAPIGGVPASRLDITLIHIVPEPSTLLLLASGLAGIAAGRKALQKKRPVTVDA